jgi:peptide/nickel transport system permease protein
MSLRVELTGIDHVLDVLLHLVLPVTALSSYYVALVARLTRSNMIDTLQSDYILTARSKGLPERRVIFVHALRNASLPVVTVIGMSFGTLLAGSITTEAVFAFPGLGGLLYNAMMNRDYPLIVGEVIILSIMIIIANLITDILYSFIDPRIRIK